MKAVWNGKVIAKSNETINIEENQYFPEEAVNKESLNSSDLLNNRKKQVMKTYAICPISDKTIDEQVARTNTVYTVLALAGFAVTLNTFLILFLLVDFFLRSTSYSKISLMRTITCSQFLCNK